MTLSTGAYGMESVRKALENGDTLSAEKINQLNPSTAEDYADIARVVNDPELASRHYIRALDQQEDPEKLQTYLREYLDLVLLLNDKLETDVELINRVKKKIGDELLGADWLQLGRFYRAVDQNDLAREAYKKALKVYETEAQARLGLIDLALEQRRFEDAERLLNEYVRTEKTTAPYWFLKGRFHELQGEQEQARLAYRQITEYHPSSLTRPLLSDTVQIQPSGDSGTQLADTEPGVKAEGTVHRIQVASFGTRERARRFRSDFQENVSHPVIIQEATLDGNVYYRVQVSGFGSRNEAEEFLKKLRSRDRDGFYLRVDAS